MLMICPRGGSAWGDGQRQALVSLPNARFRISLAKMTSSVSDAGAFDSSAPDVYEEVGHLATVIGHWP